MRRRGVNFEVEGGEVQREDVFIPPLETEKKNCWTWIARANKRLRRGLFPHSEATLSS